MASNINRPDRMGMWHFTWIMWGFYETSMGVFHFGECDGQTKNSCYGLKRLTPTIQETVAMFKPKLVILGTLLRQSHDFRSHLCI